MPFNGNLDGALERNSTTYVTIEGLDLGEIRSLTIEALTADMNSAWLPESITVESKLLKEKATFIFNENNGDEVWITKKSGPVTKFLN